jgi:hypothetical protein
MIRTLMAIDAATLFIASAIHFGIFGPIDPFEAAALPEALIGSVLAFGLIGAIFWWPSSWPAALGATLFAVVGTLVGLRFTLPRGELGDIVYHLGLLATLLMLLVMLARERPRARKPV